IPAREIADEAGISFGSYQHILSNVLDINRVASCLIPRNLNFLQKDNRLLVSSEMISTRDEDSTYMKRIITDDETWVYQYDVETK
ncbi:hypothetical protein EAI_16617, partial [Harpegnathos saltator]